MTEAIAAKRLSYDSQARILKGDAFNEWRRKEWLFAEQVEKAAGRTALEVGAEPLLREGTIGRHYFYQDFTG
jgi:hypothetical protein